MSWADVIAKFNRLSAPVIEPALQDEIVATIGDLERHAINDLTSLVAQVD